MEVGEGSDQTRPLAQLDQKYWHLKAAFAQMQEVSNSHVLVLENGIFVRKSKAKN